MTADLTAPPQSLSVVIPARDAAGVIDGCLTALLSQECELDFDVVVAIGPSRDDTVARVEAWCADDPRVRWVDNPSGLTPTALNLAVAACDGDLVVRVDAQAEVPEGYLQRVLETSGRTGAGNVGGIQRAVGGSGWSGSIAAAMRSRFGVGPAQFRSGSHEGPTDTVYLGAFRRAALDEVGGYDESLVRNQDYELNWRLREAGHVVWLDPQLVVEYRPRGSLRALWSQYFQYGRWKRVVVLRNPRSLRARQVAAPGLVVGLAASLVLLVAGSLLGLVIPAIYAAAVIGFATRPRGASKPQVAAAYVTMHLAWGCGFLFGR
ncbi:MAG: glycosyltransferase family 2 protein [Actinomycetota bacterium]